MRRSDRTDLWGLCFGRKTAGLATQPTGCDSEPHDEDHGAAESWQNFEEATGSGVFGDGFFGCDHQDSNDGQDCCQTQAEKCYKEQPEQRSAHGNGDKEDDQSCGTGNEAAADSNGEEAPHGY